MTPARNHDLSLLTTFAWQSGCLIQKRLLSEVTTTLPKTWTWPVLTMISGSCVFFFWFFSLSAISFCRIIVALFYRGFPKLYVLLCVYMLRVTDADSKITNYVQPYPCTNLKARFQESFRLGTSKTSYFA